MSNSEIQFLFASVVPNAACQRCFDTGIWLTPHNFVAVCPRIVMREKHALANPAAFLVQREAKSLFEKRTWINTQAFDVARILSNFTSAVPLKKELIFEVLWAETGLGETQKLRKFHAIIEELRNFWLLPVASRKTEPCGYWICTNLDDYKAWYNRAKSAPITQLSTLHRNARHNFPVFAEQLEIEFWNDVEPEAEKDVAS